MIYLWDVEVSTSGQVDTLVFLWWLDISRLLYNGILMLFTTAQPHYYWGACFSVFGI